MDTLRSRLGLVSARPQPLLPRYCFGLRACGHLGLVRVQLSVDRLGLALLFVMD